MGNSQNAPRTCRGDSRGRGGVPEKRPGGRIVGRLKQDKWTDADGKPRSRIFIVTEHVLLDPRDG
jgi:hypothetical protein